MSEIKNPFIQVNSLTTSFTSKSTGAHKAVNDLSYTIERGSTLGIVGESGCGKSVTSYSLMRLIEPPGKIESGQFLMEGKDLFALNDAHFSVYRGGKMAMIFQDPMTTLNPVITIGAQIDEQILRHQGVSSKEAQARSIEMLNLVGIPSPHQRYSSYPHQLSGGMRQRAIIAMALSCNPQFLIADEPTTALDVTIQAQILELIQNLQEKFKMSVQFITHDLGVISEISDKVLVMYGGQKCEEAPTDILFRSPRHPYTAALIEARPKFGEDRRRLKTIEGNVPAPHELNAGCPFANRCDRVQKECWTQRPPLVDYPNNQSVFCFNPLK